jgi:hypothetical protein
MDTFYDNTTAECVLRLTYPDGRSTVDRFATLADFRQAIDAVERQLSDDNWIQDGMPVFIPDGFPSRRLG